MAGNVIDDASKAVSLLGKLAEFIQQYPVLSGVLAVVVLVVLIVWVCLNFDVSRVFYPMEHKEKRKGETLDGYLASELAGCDETKRTISDLREAHYFKIATGIYAENLRRKAYVQLYESMPHLISWRLIRRALPYLDITPSGCAFVRQPSWDERLSYRYNQCIGFSFLIIAAVIMYFGILSGVAGFIGYIGFVFGSACVATIAFMQNWPMLAAKRIEEEQTRLAAAVPSATAAPVAPSP